MARGQEDVTKLPRWAQQRIAKLESDVEYYKAKLAVGPEDSDTFADRGLTGAARPLGRGTFVSFELGGGAVVKARVQQDHRGRAFLDVTGQPALTVRPQNHSAVAITAEDDRDG